MRMLTNTQWTIAVFGVYLVVLFMLVFAGSVFGPIPIAW
jgi:hypothetical protein